MSTVFCLVRVCPSMQIPSQFCRDQSGVVKFYGSFAFNRKRNVLELEIKQDYTSPGTQKYVVSFFFPKMAFLHHFLPSLNKGRACGWREGGPAFRGLGEAVSQFHLLPHRLLFCVSTCKSYTVLFNIVVNVPYV